MSRGAPTWVWIFTPLVALSFVGFLFYLTSIPASDDIDKITESLNQQASTAKQKIKDSAKQVANEALAKAIKEQLPETVKSEALNKTINKAVDNYEFFEILENKEVKVEKVAEYKSTPKGYNKDGKKIQYRLKAASFKTQERADRMKAQLTLNGFNTQIEDAEINGKTWYRVFTGPFDNRSKMNKAQDQMVNMGINPVEIKQTL